MAAAGIAVALCTSASAQVMAPSTVTPLHGLRVVQPVTAMDALQKELDALKGRVVALEQANQALLQSVSALQNENLVLKNQAAAIASNLSTLDAQYKGHTHRVEYASHTHDVQGKAYYQKNTSWTEPPTNP